MNCKQCGREFEETEREVIENGELVFINNAFCRACQGLAWENRYRLRKGWKLAAPEPLSKDKRKSDVVNATLLYHTVQMH